MHADLIHVTWSTTTLHTVVRHNQPVTHLSFINIQLIETAINRYYEVIMFDAVVRDWESDTYPGQYQHHDLGTLTGPWDQGGDTPDTGDNDGINDRKLFQIKIISIVWIVINLHDPGEEGGIKWWRVVAARTSWNGLWSSAVTIICVNTKHVFM